MIFVGILFRISWRILVRFELFVYDFYFCIIGDSVVCMMIFSNVWLFVFVDVVKFEYDLYVFDLLDLFVYYVF